jgi:NAD(P)H-hydrate epimerase
VPVLALDIPSGLHADTGEILGTAVRAQRTLAFIGLKLGFYLGEGPNCVGVVMFDDFELPPEALKYVEPAATLIDEADVAELLPPRRRTAHKGQQGSVLVIGGNIGMAGAARMAGEAALRAGAGLVNVATRN